MLHAPRKVISPVVNWNYNPVRRLSLHKRLFRVQST